MTAPYTQPPFRSPVIDDLRHTYADLADRSIAEPRQDVPVETGRVALVGAIAVGDPRVQPLLRIDPQRESPCPVSDLCG